MSDKLQECVDRFLEAYQLEVNAREAINHAADEHAKAIKLFWERSEEFKQFVGEHDSGRTYSLQDGRTVVIRTRDPRDQRGAPKVEVYSASGERQVRS